MFIRYYPYNCGSCRSRTYLRWFRVTYLPDRPRNLIVQLILFGTAHPRPLIQLTLTLTIPTHRCLQLLLQLLQSLNQVLEIRSLRGWDSNSRHLAYETKLEPLQSTPQYCRVDKTRTCINLLIPNEAGDQLPYYPLLLSAIRESNPENHAPKACAYANSANSRFNIFPIIQWSFF